MPTPPSSAQTPLEPLELVALCPQFIDPAIDQAEPPKPDPATPPEHLPLSREAMVSKYFNTRNWRVLRMKGDAKPNLFYCAHLPLSLVFDVLEDMPESRRLKTVFLLSCHRIVLASGKALECGPTVPYAGGGAGAVVPVDQEAWLQVVRDRFGAEAIRMLATLVYRHATEPLPPELLAPLG